MPDFVTVKGIKYYMEIDGLDLVALEINELDEIENLFKLENLRSLDLYNNNIENIEGLERLKNLKILILDHNNISETVNFNKLTNLETLSLHGNSLRKINGIEDLVNLKKLNLSDNKIAEIRLLDSLTNLEILELWWNQISEIKGLENLFNLRELNLQRNLIDEIKNISHLKCLEILGLSDNKISKIDGLKTLEDLKEIDISGNPLIKNHEKYLAEKTIDAKEIVKYCKTKELEEVLPSIYYDQSIDFEEIPKILKSEINKIEKPESFVNIGTHREDVNIKRKQNHIFFKETPTQVELNKKVRKNRIIFNLIQIHSLKGVKTLKNDKVGKFLFFIKHFWDNHKIDQDGVLIYNNFEIRVCEKLNELIDLSFKKYSSESFFYKPNVLVFPENSIPYNYLDKLVEISKNEKCLIIGGLEHKKDKECYINQAFIIDNGKLDFQTKQTPVIIYDTVNKKTIKENIKCEKLPKIKVFKTSIGNVSIFICKDFLRLFEILPYWSRKNKIDYVVVPSFTNKLLPFYAKILEMFTRPDSKDLKLIFNNMGEYGGSELFSVSKIPDIEEMFRLDLRDNVGERIVIRQILTKKKDNEEEHSKSSSMRIYDIDEFIEYVMKQNPKVVTIDDFPVLTTATGADIISRIDNYRRKSEKYVTTFEIIDDLEKRDE